MVFNFNLQSNFNPNRCKGDTNCHFISFFNDHLNPRTRQLYSWKRITLNLVPTKLWAHSKKKKTKLWALINGLFTCIRLRLQSVEVELDAKMVVILMTNSVVKFGHVGAAYPQ